MDYPTLTNLALQALGTRTTVSAAELAGSSTNEAIQANLILYPTRDRLLRMAPWSCATGGLPLQYITSVPGTPENQASAPSQQNWVPGLPLPPWVYEYAYPVDCLRALWVIPQPQPGMIDGQPIYPSAVSTGFFELMQGPPIKFNVATDQFYTVTNAAVSGGGGGYAIGDLIILAGTPSGSQPIGAPASLQVASVGLGGAITSVTIINSVTGEASSGGGSYFYPQPNPQIQGSTSGLGGGATFNLTYTTSKSSQRIILTNQEYAVLAYIRRVTDPNVFDDLFLEAYVNILGARLAMALTGDKTLANQLISLANASIVEARSVDGNEALTVNDVTPDFMRVRGITFSDYWTAGTYYDFGGFWSVY